jgi:hypothetical protein
LPQWCKAGLQILLQSTKPQTVTALIGSNSKDTAGDLYVAEKQYALFRPENLRKKRMLDLIICGSDVFRISSVVLVWIQQGRKQTHPKLGAGVAGQKNMGRAFGQKSMLQQFPSARPSCN